MLQTGNKRVLRQLDNAYMERSVIGHKVHTYRCHHRHQATGVRLLPQAYIILYNRFSLLSDCNRKIFNNCRLTNVFVPTTRKETTVRDVSQVTINTLGNREQTDLFVKVIITILCQCLFPVGKSTSTCVCHILLLFIYLSIRFIPENNFCFSLYWLYI